MIGLQPGQRERLRHRSLDCCDDRGLSAQIIRAWLKAVHSGDGGGVQLRAVLCGEPLSGDYSDGAEARQPCLQVRTFI